MLENPPKIFWYTFCGSIIYVLLGITVFMAYWTMNSNKMSIVYDRLELTYQKSEKINDDIVGLHKKIKEVVDRTNNDTIDEYMNEIEKKLLKIRDEVEEHHNNIAEQRAMIK